MAIRKDEIEEIVKKSIIEIADVAEKNIDKKLIEGGGVGQYFSTSEFHYDNQRVYQELVRRYEAAGWKVQYDFDQNEDEDWIYMS